MPSGGQGNFAGTGGYGGQFPGFGGASAGYTGGYGNPSSVGGGTAGQTYAGQAYANTLNKYNPTLGNYSGVSGPSAAQNAQNKAQQKQIRAQQGSVSPEARQAALAQNAAQLGPAIVGPFSSTNPVPGKPEQENGLGFGNTQYPHTQYQHTPTPMGEGGVLGFGGAGNWNNAGGYMGTGGGLQFGGPVAPGGQYTVGENGPETLQMRPGGGGRVIPNNPADRRVALANALQGRGGGAGITGLNRAAPAPSPPAVRPAAPLGPRVGGPAPMPAPGGGAMRPPIGPRPMSGWQG